MYTECVFLFQFFSDFQTQKSPTVRDEGAMGAEKAVFFVFQRGDKITFVPFGAFSAHSFLSRALSDRSVPKRAVRKAATTVTIPTACQTLRARTGHVSDGRMLRNAMTTISALPPNRQASSVLRFCCLRASWASSTSRILASP